MTKGLSDLWSEIFGHLRNCVSCKMALMLHLDVYAYRGFFIVFCIAIGVFLFFDPEYGSVLRKE